MSIVISQDILPLAQRYFHSEDMGVDYSRGIYLIVLSDASLESILRDDATGDFIQFKKTQGYDVEIISMEGFGEAGYNLHIQLRQFLDNYYMQNPLLEYVLLVGDVDGSYSIPAFSVASYSYDEIDITDHTYTFFDDDPLTPNFFIGRWSIRTEDELEKIKSRSIGYVTMNLPGTDPPYPLNPSYLNNALMVAGNYGDTFFPVTPVWTSQWLMDELYNYGYSQVDTAFWQLGDQDENPMIENKWNEGVGVIGYRGWGGATGWAYPDFRNSDLEALENTWKLPVVFSYVCNTGDFDRSGGDHCFAEKALTVGSPGSPTGAVAVVGPSDKDTDTKFNNPMYGTMMDALLEKRIPELAPALHAGKQCLIKEFGDLLAPSDYGFDGTYAEFYHYVYNVLGDPSLPVWLGEPKNMTTNLTEGASLTSSHISIIIRNEAGEPLMDVVGALIDGDELIDKGLSNAQGELVIDFNDLSVGSNLALYLNKAQYYQKKIDLHYGSDDGEVAPQIDYRLVSDDVSYLYTFIDSESDNTLTYNWIEINEIGENLNLTDDSVISDLDLGFEFRYYGIPYTNLTVCSNGWVSFNPCLKAEGSSNECNPLAYFYNNSIGHAIGPYAMIAPFFDDLDDNGGSEPFNVYYWTNNQDSVIIEWHEVAQRKTDEFCPDCEKETFQLILDNSDVSGVDNGKIIFQYKEIYDIDTVEDHGATVGVEAPDKNSGTQYLFNYSYHSDASVLQDSLAIQFSSNQEPLEITDISTYQPSKIQLIGTYPNPFNPVTTVFYRLPELCWINLDVYNIRGQEVVSLYEGMQYPGTYQLNWDASVFSSGVYFITLSSSHTRLIQKVLLLK